VKKEFSEKKELSEEDNLKAELAECDKKEEEKWRIKTDPAAFGRTRIKIPDRWE